jgi:hypothetical protein
MKEKIASILTEVQADEESSSASSNPDPAEEDPYYENAEIEISPDAVLIEIETPNESTSHHDNHPPHNRTKGIEGNVPTERSYEKKGKREPKKGKLTKRLEKLAIKENEEKVKVSY